MEIARHRIGTWMGRKLADFPEMTRDDVTVTPSFASRQRDSEWADRRALETLFQHNLITNIIGNNYKPIAEQVVHDVSEPAILFRPRVTISLYKTREQGHAPYMLPVLSRILCFHS